MEALARFNWQAFDPVIGLKVTSGFIIMLLLEQVTGGSWFATGMVVLFAWLSNTPGRLNDRVAGLAAFGAGAIALTLIFGQIGLAALPNTILMAALGFLGALALLWSDRAFMVGYVLICWAIYGPLMVEGTSVENCIVAIILGVTVIVSITAAPFALKSEPEQTAVEQAPADVPTKEFVIAYAIIVAIVLGLTSYLGLAYLKTDPTLIVGGAFFVIGFDLKTTWDVGIARVIGVVSGTFIGFAIGDALGSGLLLDIVAVAAFFLCFATMSVHPGAFMFFFLIIIALTWSGLDVEMLNVTGNERFVGETLGVVIAILAIVLLRQFQKQRAQ